jgi:alpha/beta superfamily hydrolase
MGERLRIPSDRDVRATLDEPPSGASAVVVAAPPHPQMGGDRTDSRLRAVNDVLVDRGVACLRFDYGPWDGGRGEQTDAERTIQWARDRYGRVALFGYSFGGGVALAAAAEQSRTGMAPAAVSVLAPAGTLAGEGTDGAVADITSPLQVVYGERDETADWESVVERAREAGATVVSRDADHFFTARHGDVAETVAAFLDR